MTRPLNFSRLCLEHISTAVNFNSSVQIYKRDCIVHAPGLPCGLSEPSSSDSKRGKIHGFSRASCRRAVFVANNSEGLTSQFLCTYHGVPTDGALIKKHLNRFLSTLRKYYPSLKYFWFLEFQQRGSPHFHVFLNVPVSKENRLKIAGYWLTASDQDHDQAAIGFHQHSNNFFEWDLSGTYVAKYASKEEQKDVPDNFTSIGRFWGCTRGLAQPVADVEVPAQVSRCARKLLLSRLRQKKNVPYRLWQLYKKTRRFIVSLYDTDMIRLFNYFGLYGYKLHGAVDKRGLHLDLINFLEDF